MSLRCAAATKGMFGSVTGEGKHRPTGVGPNASVRPRACSVTPVRTAVLRGGGGGARAASGARRRPESAPWPQLTRLSARPAGSRPAAPGPAHRPGWVQSCRCARRCSAVEAVVRVPRAVRVVDRRAPMAAAHAAVCPACGFSPCCVRPGAPTGMGSVVPVRAAVLRGGGGGARAASGARRRPGSAPWPQLTRLSARPAGSRPAAPGPAHRPGWVQSCRCGRRCSSPSPRGCSAHRSSRYGPWGCSRWAKAARRSGSPTALMPRTATEVR
ncbi:hypothetical protein M2163_007181 [Streptomyces sp. SAI-135]|nr:hypothetical protein [Streptomyces sp. SAI-090]MDH6620073.1 hypothetical protein [Streptomyces sp. SAI-135]